ncbi:MAG: hypothetical protein RIS35_2949 [Pseudomonadota bacterium]
MATPTRPYVIRGLADKSIVGIVRAATPAQALRHHVRGMFSVDPASAEDAFEAAANGIKLEVAGIEAGSHEAQD